MLEAAEVSRLPHLTRTVSCPFVYALLALTLDADSPITDKLLRDIISKALQQLFGYIGGAVVLDVLSVADAHATIRVDKRDWSKLWSAITVLAFYNGVKCKIEVLQHSPFLQSLAA